MIPAEESRAAAQKIRDLAKAATPGPWADPGVAELVAAMLDLWADALEDIPVGAELFRREHAALDLARAINQGNTP